MPFLKLKAERIFDGFRFLNPETVLIADTEGRIRELVAEADAGEGIRRLPGILMPGMINGHCHLELSHLKGIIPEGTGMTEFLLAVIGYRDQGKEFLDETMRKADREMWDAGIVATGDICNTTDSLNVKNNSRIRYIDFVEATGFLPEYSAKRFAEAERVCEAFLRGRQGMAPRVSMVPHAPYSVSGDLFQMILQYSRNRLVSMHSQESEEEDLFFREKRGGMMELFGRLGIGIDFFHPTGKSSLQSVLPYFPASQSLILVHNLTTGPEDLQVIRQARSSGMDIWFCLCPNANLYIHRRLPDIPLLLDSGIPILLGTDSLASNRQLSVLAEIRLLKANFPELELEKLLSWASLSGAKALQMDDLLGSFEKDKKPGLVNIDEGLTSAERIL